MELTFKLFIRKDKKLVFGPGRWKLLEEVDTAGSLQKAAKNMGISYRWAWGRLRDVENALGVTLMTRSEDTASGRPKILTPEGRALLEWYRKANVQVLKAVDDVEKKCSLVDFFEKISKNKLKPDANKPSRSVNK